MYVTQLCKAWEENRKVPILAFYNVLVLEQSSSEICQLYTIKATKNVIGLTIKRLSVQDSSISKHLSVQAFWSSIVSAFQDLR